MRCSRRETVKYFFRYRSKNFWLSNNIVRKESVMRWINESSHLKKLAPFKYLKQLIKLTGHVKWNIKFKNALNYEKCKINITPCFDTRTFVSSIVLFMFFTSWFYLIYDSYGNRKKNLNSRFRKIYMRWKLQIVERLILIWCMYGALSFGTDLQ